MNNRWRMKRRAKSFYQIVKEGLAKMHRNSFYGISSASMLLTDNGIRLARKHMISDGTELKE